jgi:putative endonuclease
MYYVYILLLNNSQLYTGSTQDIKQRIKDHKEGRVTSTKFRRPLRLIHFEGYFLKSDVLRRERFLKTTEGKRLLRQQIRDCLNKFQVRPIIR